MADIIGNHTYLAVRLGLWCALGTAVAIDTVRHWTVRSTGYILSRLVALTVAVRLLDEILVFFLADFQTDDAEHVRHISIEYGVLIFSGNLSAAVFMALLMIISCGYCITTTQLKHTRSIIAAPIILFVSSLVVDYIIELEAGHNTSHDPASGRNLSTVHFSSDFEKRVMFAMSATNFFTLIYMWLWIFQSTRLVLHELHWDLQTPAQRAAHEAALRPFLENVDNVLFGVTEEEQARQERERIARERHAVDLTTGAPPPYTPETGGDEAVVAAAPDVAERRLASLPPPPPFDASESSLQDTSASAAAVLLASAAEEPNQDASTTANSTIALESLPRLRNYPEDGIALPPLRPVRNSGRRPRRRRSNGIIRSSSSSSSSSNSSGGGGGSVSGSNNEEEDGSDGATHTHDDAESLHLKYTLMYRYNISVSLYLLAEVALLVLTALKPSASTWLLIALDIVLFLFLSSLAFIFRLRKENPYFLIASDVDAFNEACVSMSVEPMDEGAAGVEDDDTAPAYDETDRDDVRLVLH